MTPWREYIIIFSVNSIGGNVMSKLSKGKNIRIALCVIIALAIVVCGCAVYLCDYYQADDDAISAYIPAGSLSVSERDGRLSIEPMDATKGFIFYPGGKVEHTAYLPLMYECAQRGILCVLLPMPFNLAVLDINAAEGIREEYPHIREWYIGGHSLGGSMAATYLARHSDEYQGLVLLGSYSTADLSATDLCVISIYGSEDGVMNREKYEKYKPNLPGNLTEIVIDGGNHAYFGMYGEQDGDGVPAISNREQICITVDSIVNIICQMD